MPRARDPYVAVLTFFEQADLAVGNVVLAMAKETMRKRNLMDDVLAKRIRETPATPARKPKSPRKTATAPAQPAAVAAATPPPPRRRRRFVEPPVSPATPLVPEDEGAEAEVAEVDASAEG